MQKYIRSFNPRRAKPEGEATRQRILQYIQEYTAEHGYAPAMREIARNLDIKSVSSVYSHVHKLEATGFLTVERNKPRTITMAANGTSSPRSTYSTRMVPVIGTVAAGTPILASSNIIDYYPYPDNTFTDDELFILKVKGDSMIKVGILNGDLVICKQTDSVADGKIVVACVNDDEATIKRIFRENDHIRLQPENDAMEPIYVKRVNIQGEVIGVIREMVS